MIKLEKYQENLDYSYAFGAFVCMELLHFHFQNVRMILIHSSFQKNDTFQQIVTICQQKDIPYFIDDYQVGKIRNKDNIYVIGVFKKYPQQLSRVEPHIVINSLHDVGTIGTIIRSMNGFNCHNLVLIASEVDIFHTHLIRASMGAIFQVNIAVYPSLEQYQQEFPSNTFYSICSQKGEKLSEMKLQKPYSLLFQFPNPKGNLIQIKENLNLENILNICIYHLFVH